MENIAGIARLLKVIDLLESNLDLCKANLKYIRLELGLETKEEVNDK